MPAAPATIPHKSAEQALIDRARAAVSESHWLVGDCAAEWTKRFARGRTDADFANLVGLTPDQIYQRRRVWETFADVRERYPHLQWSHFYVALTWDDAPESLQWADEQEATVAEMRAWRRAVRGEELQDEAEAAPIAVDVADPPPPRSLAIHVPPEPTAIKDAGPIPAKFHAPAGSPAPMPTDQLPTTNVQSPPVASAARTTETPRSPTAEYAPFRADASAKPKGTGPTSVAAPASSTPAPGTAGAAYLRAVKSALTDMLGQLTIGLAEDCGHCPDERREVVSLAQQLALRLRAG